MRRLGILLISLLVVGCTPSEEAKKAVARNTRDPSSVQFRDVRTVRQIDGTKAVCGQYNAKNGFGAYVGFQDFSYHQGEVHMKIPYDTANSDDMEALTRSIKGVSLRCTRAGRSEEEFDAYISGIHAEADRTLKSAEK